MFRNCSMHFAAWAHVAKSLNHGCGRRRAVTLMPVIICLLVIMLFSGAVVRALTLRNRESRRDEQQLQCLFLVESAVSRAHAQCRRDPNFAGELWRVSMESHGKENEGVARIQVEPVAGEPTQRRVTIEARWPDDPVIRVQRTKELVIRLPDSGATL